MAGTSTSSSAIDGDTSSMNSSRPPKSSKRLKRTVSKFAFRGKELVNII